MKQLVKLILVIIFLIPLSGINAQKVIAQKHGIHKRHTKKVKKRNKVHFKYAKLPKWGHTYKTAPAQSLIIKHRNKQYFVHSGVFYYKKGRRYRVVKAPIGIRVSVLPKYVYRFKLHNRPYFYYYGTFYVQSENNEYMTIEPPTGAKVDALPEGYKEVIYNGEQYYKLEGVYYKLIIDNDGQELYEVVDL